MLSLPIPELGGAPYRTVPAGDWGTAADLIAQLYGPAHKASRYVRLGGHVDPDLVARPDAVPGWRPALGQAGAAAGHLRNQGVGPGDRFVFWGLFRHTTVTDAGTLAWRSGSKPFHAVFGWLDVAAVHDLSAGQGPDWAARHPHVLRPERANNTLYAAGDPAGHPGGAGVCRWHPLRRLTAPDAPGPSRWALPADLHPDTSGTDLSYHGDAGRWQADGDRCVLSVVGRGQEFVVDTAASAGGARWAQWARVVTAPAHDTDPDPQEPTADRHAHAEEWDRFVVYARDVGAAGRFAAAHGWWLHSWTFRTDEAAPERPVVIDVTGPATA